MKKETKPQVDVWNSDDNDSITETPIESPDIITSVEELKPEAYRKPSRKFSKAGLKADFPTAKELEQFVFDETNIALKLKGVDPELKYELALSVLNGEPVDPEYITGHNPYIDHAELVPEDPIRPIPARDPRLPNEEPMSIFHDFNIPHPDREMRAYDHKVICQFRKYNNGAISYEILGPLEKHAEGEKLDKYGRARPEKFTWVDPRTGEQAIRLGDGTYTKMGQRLRTLMEAKRVNKNATVWSLWVDKDFTAFNQDRIENPWD